MDLNRRPSSSDQRAPPAPRARTCNFRKRGPIPDRPGMLTTLWVPSSHALNFMERLSDAFGTPPPFIFGSLFCEWVPFGHPESAAAPMSLGEPTSAARRSRSAVVPADEPTIGIARGNTGSLPGSIPPTVRREGYTVEHRLPRGGRWNDPLPLSREFERSGDQERTCPWPRVS
jgi:hypothetical protein